jgi:hypothetical protein
MILGLCIKLKDTLSAFGVEEFVIKILLGNYKIKTLAINFAPQCSQNFCYRDVKLTPQSITNTNIR